jgi:Mn2+/Fe2+ NRAMP family transporter
VTGLSWRWIALMATLPPVAGLLVAYPCWKHRQPILGNLAGATVIFGAALGLILRESAVLDGLSRQCLDAGYYCFPSPSAFSRYAIYAFIALFEVFGLFTASLSVEQKIRRSGYDPEWR